MSVVDIISGLNASIFPQIGIIFFLAAFGGLAIRLLRRGGRAEPAAFLPLTEAPLAKDMNTARRGGPKGGAS